MSKTKTLTGQKKIFLALHGQGVKGKMKSKNPRASPDAEFNFKSGRAFSSPNLQVLHKTKPGKNWYLEKTRLIIFITIEATNMKNEKVRTSPDVFLKCDFNGI